MTLSIIIRRFSNFLLKKNQQLYAPGINLRETGGRGSKKGWEERERESIEEGGGLHLKARD